jgi:hypothetical protein
MRTGVRAAVIATAAALCSGLSAARAADAEYCKGYASAALHQVRSARSNPACAPGAQGARWAQDDRVHYDWCLGQLVAATGEERDARANYLRACR